jgi:hypothetical protein
LQGDLSRTSENRESTHRALGHDLAFASLLAAVIALVVALALDFTTIVPLLAGKDTYNPIRDFLSYQVHAKSGPLMTGAFPLLAVSA